MATFNFPYHSVETEYPNSGTQIKLGNSYAYTAPPEAPDQRLFKLSFPLLKYFEVNGAIDSSVEPQINLAALELFYNLHKMSATFTYPHPVYGELACKFNKPLKIPKGIPGGGGAVPNIDVELIEVPGMADSGLSEMTLIEYEDFPL